MAEQAILSDVTLAKGTVAAGEVTLTPAVPVVTLSAGEILAGEVTLTPSDRS